MNEVRNLPKLGFRPAGLAESLDVSEGFIRKEIRLGKLKALKLGAAVIITADAVSQYLAAAEGADVKSDETKDADWNLTPSKLVA